ncbi:type VI secretion system protein TssA [Pseudomonas batumici]|uniref:Uncharacterized protein ImpA n=1 Tax=Pseudomonas batumici TaxID=226910 RepID=A0A0C2I2H7_9PSED|nr:type VI secretion system protein TssA [Pseudomonas batumici]KIH83456.1 Uncharacterized protein ImpA [Pseudomonas batumici]
MTIDTSSLDQLRLRLPGLIDPLPGADPAGVSLREAPEMDLLREARREDDASLPTGIWQTDLKRADWARVETLASELLTRRSKDLLVATWLGEAWLQRYQLPGLCVALELLVGLCERYGPALHPRAQGDDASWLAPPLALLVRQYSLLLNIRLPLLGTAARGFENLTLEQWMRAQKQALNKSEERKAKALAQESQDLLRDWREALLRVPVGQLDARLQLFNACLQSVEQLNRWCDSQLGGEAPSFAALQNILDLHVHALREFIAMHPEPLPVPVSLPVEPTVEEPAAVTTAAVPLSLPESRQAAYRQLKVISDYLKRVEPHSPVPYLINRAVDWGNMELPELLGELIKADPDIQRIWRLLGVLP